MNKKETQTCDSLLLVYFMVHFHSKTLDTDTHEIIITEKFES